MPSCPSEHPAADRAAHAVEGIAADPAAASQSTKVCIMTSGRIKRVLLRAYLRKKHLVGMHTVQLANA